MKPLLEQQDEGTPFAHGGEMGERIRRHDWAATSLGAPQSWPASLRNAVNLVLACPLPAVLTWGEQGTQLYNDAFMAILGARHPRALGQDFDDCWHGAFPGSGLPVHSATAPGVADSQRLFLARDRAPGARDRAPGDGQLTETFFTHAVTPILGEGGETAGYLHQLFDVTNGALATRRLRVLHSLTQATASAATPEQCLLDATAGLADSGADLPFVLCYVLDDSGATARLVAATSFPPGGPDLPQRQDVAAGALSGVWPIGPSLAARFPLTVTDVQARFAGLTAGPYPEPITSAFLLPIGDGADGGRAVIVAGVSQRARLDEPYRAFFALLAASLAESLAKATAAQAEPPRQAALVELDRARSALAKLREQTTQKLDEANQELETFSYSISHDLRTPLRAIDGFSRALLTEQGDKLDEQGRRYLERIRAGTQRMAELIDDLLGLARIGRASPKRERVDLSALARKVLGELAASEPERDVASYVADGLVVEADPRLMTCLLENLLGNAWKFSSRTARARIEVTTESLAGADHVFVVRDNGAGFNMDYAKKLFQPFQRLHAASEFPGTGIGLATVLRIVRRHGGRVWAHAAPDQGARFYFTLREPA